MTVWIDVPKKPDRAADEDLIVLGFDGSKGRVRGVADSCALVGIRLSDAYLHVLGLWEHDREGWEPPRAEIEARVEDMFDSGLVVGGRFDPAGGWADTIARWENKYRAQLWYPHLAMLPNQHGKSWDAFFDAIDNRRVRVDFDRDPALREHLLAARNRGPTVGKEHRGPAAAKMDLAAAGAYGWRAYLEAEGARPQTAEKKQGAEVWGYNSWA